MSQRPPASIEEIEQWLYQLETGYRLWVGAGLTLCLASGQTEVPDWDLLTKELEEVATIDSSASSEIDLPKRLDRCRETFRQQEREEEFDRYLRQHYYHKLCCAVLRLARAQNQQF